LVLREHIAHHGLGLAAGINFGIVKKVDARPVGGSHALAGQVFTHLDTERNPRAKREFADFQSGTAEVTIVHEISIIISLRLIRCPMASTWNRP
jgi:hypothetical protein